MAQQRQGRPYNAEGRRAQARLNRERVLGVARELFVERGYAGVSVAEIAAAAGFSSPTVFAQFGSKVRLLKEAAETALVGDADPEPLATRPMMVHVREAPTAGEVLDRLAALIVETAPRTCPIYLVVYAAADSDPQIAALAEELDAQRLQGAAQLADAVLGKPGRPSIPGDADPHTARAALQDTIWTHNSPLLYRLLVLQRGWSAEQYGEWLRRGLRAHAGLDTAPATTR